MMTEFDLWWDTWAPIQAGSIMYDTIKTIAKAAWDAGSISGYNEGFADASNDEPAITAEQAMYEERNRNERLERFEDKD